MRASMAIGSLFALTMATAVADDSPPFLGVSTSIHAEAVEAQGRAFRHGLKVEFVWPESGAEAAGVRVGDVIVAMSGVDFDVPTERLRDAFQAGIQARKVGDALELTFFRSGVEKSAELDGRALEQPQVWKDPDALVAEREPGSQLQLTVTRFAGFVTARVLLGARPEMAELRAIPPNDVLLPKAVPLMPEAGLIAAMVERYEARADYDRLRQRLAGLVERGDSWRLRRVAYAMREPLAAANLGRELSNLSQEIPQALTHAGMCLDRSLPDHVCKLKTGLAPEEHARQIEDVLKRAAEMVNEAFAKLDAEERKFLEDTLGDVCSCFREVVMVLSDPDLERRARVRRFMQVAEKVDTRKLLAAAVYLSGLTDPQYLAGLAVDLAGRGDGIILKQDTPLGAIVLAGQGSQWHHEPAAVIVDLGGDEHYTHETRRPISIVIDLQGDDVYQATFDGAQAGGIFGVALLSDRDGNDQYIGQQWAQGAGALGVGVLHDAAGNDQYRGQDYSQGAAFVGVGLLLDEDGDDRYEAPRYAQGLGMPGGYGGLLDRAGTDHYYVGGRDRTNYETVGVFDAFGQGCGIGFRGLASGGVGLLRDDGGDDTYTGHNFAQGGGYFFGWGVLIDRAGDDRYLGARYAQAWAAHQALGLLEDHAGNDYYSCWRGVGQSCSWDETVSVLLDHSGDDVYSGGGFALCAAHNNGWAFLGDYAGNDVYQQCPDAPRADGDEEVSSFALQLDFGGGADHYGAEPRGGMIRHGNRHGFLADFAGSTEGATRELERLMRE